MSEPAAPLLRRGLEPAVPQVKRGPAPDKDVACQPARLGLAELGQKRTVRAHGGTRIGAIGAAAALAIISVAGCAKLSAALGHQWIVVQFKPNTTIATARHVTQTCSHVPNLRLAPIRPASANPGMIDSARYNATNATDANLAELQGCLGRFPSVIGFTQVQPGDM